MSRAYRIESANPYLGGLGMLLGGGAWIVCIKLMEPLSEYFIHLTYQVPNWLGAVVSIAGCITGMLVGGRVLVLRRYHIHWQDDMLCVQRMSWRNRTLSQMEVSRDEVQSYLSDENNGHKRLRLRLNSGKKISFWYMWALCRKLDFYDMEAAAKHWMHKAPASGRRRIAVRERTFWERPAAVWAIGLWSFGMILFTGWLLFDDMGYNVSISKLVWFYCTWGGAIAFWWKGRSSYKS